MEQETKLYWPQRKVYLYGQLAFLPDEIEGKPLRAAKLRHYFEPDNLAAELAEYEQESYFHVQATGRGEFRLTKIDSHKARKHLTAYLKQIKPHLPATQRAAPWEIAAKQYRRHKYRPVIRWKDIYGDTTRYDFSPPFWELIFIPALAGKVRLVKVGHDRTVPYLQKGDKMIPMPEELRPFYERPYAEFEVIDSALRDKISQSRGKKHIATLKLTPRNLWLILDGKHYPICSYKNTNGNSYRVAAALYSAKKPLTLDELNLKPGTTTRALHHLLSNAGFRGILRELFTDSAYDDGRHRPTMALKKSVELDKKQHDRLLKYVKSLSEKTE